MRKLLLILLFLFPACLKAQNVVVGQSCPASGQSSIATNGSPVLCAGSPLIWTAIGGGGVGGITMVTSLPATCIPGTTSPVSLSVNGIGYGTFICSTTNVWTPENPTQAISPLAYGAKWDVKVIHDATFTVTSNVVTCTNSNCNFTAADQGKLIFGTTFPSSQTVGCNGAGCGSYLLTTTLGFICPGTTANSVTIGTTFPGCAPDNATANCSPGASSCALIWGTQDDQAAIMAAATAAWTGNSCRLLQFPSGYAFFTVPSGGLLNIALPTGSPCAGNVVSDMIQMGAQVAGTGNSTSGLIPLPTVNFINCTAGSLSRACIAGPPSWVAHDWGIFGEGQSGSGTPHNVDLLQFNGNTPGCTGAAAYNMILSNWQAASATSQGFVMQSVCGVAYASNIVVEGFGNTNCVLGNLSSPAFPTTVTGLDCFGSSGGGTGASLLVTGGNVVSTGSAYWGVNAAATNPPAVELTGTSTIYNSFSDTIEGASNGNNAFGIWMNATANTVNLSGSNVSMVDTIGGGASSLIFCPSAATICNLSSYSSTLTASGSLMRMFLKTGTPAFNYFDACANNYTQGGTANSTLNIFGSCSITGTPITAAKLVLSANWGTSAAWSALTGATQSIQGTITNGTAATGASPTITYTFPTPFLQAPAFCSAYQVGGTQAITAATEFLTPSSLTNTGVTFTYNGTPTINLTEVYQILCSNQ